MTEHLAEAKQDRLFDVSKLLPKRVDEFKVKITGATATVSREIAEQLAVHGARVWFAGSGRRVDHAGKTAKSEGTFTLTFQVEADELLIDQVEPPEENPLSLRRGRSED